MENITDNNNGLGVRVRTRRIELGMTQEELAKKLGYTNKSTIGKIESGINDITQSKALEFAKALDTSVAYIMGWEEPTEGYYTNPETAQLAQDLFDDPSMRMLFDAARDAKPEDLQKAADFLKAAKALTLNLDNEGC